MAIEKTGVRLTASGHQTVTKELSGAQSLVNVDGLDADTTYTVSAYIVDEIGTVNSSNTRTVHLMAAGEIKVDPIKAVYDQSGGNWKIHAEFKSLYDIEDRQITVYWADDAHMTNPTRYQPTVTMYDTTSGELDLTISDAEATRYMVIHINDIYGYVSDDTPIQCDPS